MIVCVWLVQACWWRPSGWPPHPIAPHTVAGCSTTLSRDGDVRWLVLTDSSHNFVAWIIIEDFGGDGTGQDDRQASLPAGQMSSVFSVWLSAVRVDVVTTEAPVCESGAFKDRYPVTTRLARVALGRVAPYVFDGQVDDGSDDDSGADVGGRDTHMVAMDGWMAFLLCLSVYVVQIPTAMAAVGMIWTSTATERAAEVHTRGRDTHSGRRIDPRRPASHSASCVGVLMTGDNASEDGDGGDEIDDMDDDSNGEGGGGEQEGKKTFHVHPHHIGRVCLFDR